MLTPAVLDAFSDELRKVAYNEAFLARKMLGTAKSLGKAKALPKAAKPPPVPVQALGRGKSRRLTPGAQAAGAKRDSDLSQIENMILAKGSR